MGVRRYVYKGKILSLAIEDDHWEIVEHKDAVALLVQDPDRGVLFVRQYRPAIGAHTLEIPAGLIEAGESPRDAAKRELAEETQLGGRLTLLAEFYVSPGFTDEKTYLFRVEEIESVPGEPDPDEDLEIVWMDPTEALARMRSGLLNISASTMVGILYAIGDRS